MLVSKTTFEMLVLLAVTKEHVKNFQQNEIWQIS